MDTHSKDILGLYTLLAIWARRMDKKDLSKLGSIPLPSNDPYDRYLYEILVVTGSRKGAGTKSKVTHLHMLYIRSVGTQNVGCWYSRYPST